jgi:hypothetical protein
VKGPAHEMALFAAVCTFANDIDEFVYKKKPRLHQKRSGLQSFDKAAIITGE